MIKLVLVFLLLFTAFYCGFELFTKLKKKQKWSVVKTAGYSALIALLTLITMIVIVLIF